MPRARLRNRLTLYLLGAVLVADLALLGVTGTSARYYLRSQLRERLMAAALTGTLLVDVEALRHIRTRADEKTPAYRDEQRRLRALRNVVSGARYVYLLRPAIDPRQWSFIVDAEEDPRLVSHPGDTYDASTAPEMLTGLRRPAADRELTWDHWGGWLSGYAPVRDRRGQAVAVLGVDMPASAVLHEEGAPLKVVLVAGLVLLLFAVFLARQIARLLAEPVAALTEAAQRVAEGDLETQVSVEEGSELTGLEEAFNSMTHALHDHEAELLALSHTDSLTGLPNHRYFQERLEAEVARAKDTDLPLSLVMLDVDHFRRVNTAHGHQGGDDLLHALGELLPRAFRGADVVARYGGEEFAVILPGAQCGDAWQVAERARRVVAAHRFRLRSLGDWVEVQITISAGVASFPGESRTADDLVVAADAALLRAKAVSRNRVCRLDQEAEREFGLPDASHLQHVLRRAGVAAVESFAAVLETDVASRGHSDNVTALGLAMARALGLPIEERLAIRMAGLLHDIGKTALPEELLDKVGPLADQEWTMLRAHPDLGAQILAQAPSMTDIIPIVRSHHERWDGTGYPEGLAGEAIPHAARILAVAEAYDAMTAGRPYQKALTREEALTELRSNAGTQFDPAAVEAFEMALALSEEGPLELAGEAACRPSG